MKLIQDLESLNLIQVIHNDIQSSPKKLSEKLTGSISKEDAESMQKELKKMRDEWERDI